MRFDTDKATYLFSLGGGDPILIVRHVSELDIELKPEIVLCAACRIGQRGFRHPLESVR